MVTCACGKTVMEAFALETLQSMPTKSTQVTKAEYEMLSNLRYALRRFLRFSEEKAREAGIGTQQHQALLTIKGFPDNQQVTVGNLAERLQIRHHSAVGLIDRLVSKGLLTRTSSSSDRRQVFLELTSRGNRVLEKLSAAHKEQLRRVGPEIEAFLRRLRD